MKEIIGRRPELVAARDRTGKTALHYCAEHHNPLCTELLLAAEVATSTFSTLSLLQPSLLEVTDSEGYTVLHLGVIKGNKSIIEFLLARGANPRAVDYEVI